MVKLVSGIQAENRLRSVETWRYKEDIQFIVFDTRLQPVAIRESLQEVCLVEFRKLADIKWAALCVLRQRTNRDNKPSLWELNGDLTNVLRLGVHDEKTYATGVRQRVSSYRELDVAFRRAHHTELIVGPCATCNEGDDGAELQYEVCPISRVL